MTLTQDQRNRTLSNQYAASIARQEATLETLRRKRAAAAEQVTTLDQEIASTEAFIERQKQRESEVGK